MKTRWIVTASLFVAGPLVAQTTTTQDPHATHRSAAGESKPAPTSDATKPVDHGDHSMHDAQPTQGTDHDKLDDAATDHAAMDHSGHSMGETQTAEGIDHSTMDHGSTAAGDMAGMDHGSMKMQGGSAPPDARDPDYSDGVVASPMHHAHVHGAGRFGSVIVDHLEAFNGGGSHGQLIDMQAWYGGDIDKLWFKAESERSDGRLGATRTELLWNHATAAYWDVQAGVRHDLGDGPSRNWAAFGVQGLAPYWFEVEATAYVGEAGRTALRLEAEYELLLTQRLILQPDVEVNFYGKDDRQRGIGRGLSDLDVGLRLRYEFTRKFAPYVGVTWSRRFGKTADFARAGGGNAQDTQLVAGVRLWF